MDTKKEKKVVKGCNRRLTITSPNKDVNINFNKIEEEIKKCIEDRSNNNVIKGSGENIRLGNYNDMGKKNDADVLVNN